MGGALVEIWIGLALLCVAWHLYHQRKMAEAARFHMKRYCDKNGLQFISIAKISSRLIRNHRGLVWQNVYDFEFNGDGDSCYNGTVTLHGTSVASVDLPPYRVSEPHM